MTGEPQYAGYKSLRRYQLGLMAGEIWGRDPKMLGIHLARYKFVAKMLAGKKHVAEIGCGDGWYSRLVNCEVGRLDLYDLDNSMDETGFVHRYDVTKDGKIAWAPRAPYDAIYSLDCFEHISLLDWDVALTNVGKSLTQDGVFILGMPSFESQEYASKASKEGHVCCLCDEQLKSVLDGRFKRVFTFGMNDEMLHVGFEPMRQYLFALCVGVK